MLLDLVYVHCYAFWERVTKIANCKVMNKGKQAQNYINNAGLYMSYYCSGKDLIYGYRGSLCKQYEDHRGYYSYQEQVGKK